jgi:hypothetical protein
MNQILIINGNDVYEIDDDCLEEKENQNNKDKDSHHQ